MGVRVGVDTGGTFTDLVAFDELTGEIRTGKRPSTPQDPAAAIFDAFEAAGVEPRQVAAIDLGTTVATNALLERSGARVVYVGTEGFRDVPMIGRIDKKDPYDLSWRKPQPYVERANCLEVGERVAYDGSLVRALDDEEVEQLVSRIAERLDAIGDVDSALAVCLLFSFVNPEHERRLAAAISARFPDLPMSFSSAVAPIWREHDRASTTIVDSYLKPVVARLAASLEKGLAERSFGGRLSIMKSNGGRADSETAAERPVEMVLSGLAGGIVAARYYGELAGLRELVSLDMGGTSADVGMVRAGSIDYVVGFELDFGLPVAVPAIDLVTLGAGGGSIAWVDDGGLLRVGPRSAGAVPGPICYGLGGEEVTVTDANLVLGRLNPDYFLGGRMPLEREKAERKVAELGSRLDLGPEETAQAIVELATEAMANAIHRAAVERGVDPRDFHLVAFGGAGPLHACGVASALGMKGVVVPPHPGLVSAFGTLVADRRVDRRATHHARSDAVDLAALNGRLESMTADAVATLRAEGFEGLPTVVRAASMRYLGQNYETDVPLPSGALDDESLATALAAFHDRHEQEFGYAFRDETVEMIDVAVTAIGAPQPPQAPALPARPAPPAAATRDVWFPGAGRLATPIFLREQLPPEFVLRGPVIVEEPDSTTLLPPGVRLEVSQAGLLLLEAAAEKDAKDLGRRIDSVTMSIVNDHLVNVTEEMGSHMMRASYSPIFSESRDFSCALFNARGEMIAQGAFCPAHLGAIVQTVEFMLDEIEPDSIQPGDVLLHNDPFRGGCHMPEHTLLKPVFHEGGLVAFAAVIGHMAEIGAVNVGSFAATATEAYQEGLRLPPVRLVAGGKPVDDVWKIILANHRTPRQTWGDLHAMTGALHAAEERLAALFAKYGVDVVLEASDQLIAYSERLVRAEIARLPDGTYPFEDGMEDDGLDDRPYRIRVRVIVDGDRLVVDYTGSDPQARGPINATFAVTTSATYNALFQLAGRDVPRNAGAHRAAKTIAPPGSVVNVRFPGPSVGGNTETQPKLVGMILGALAAAIPERVMAAEGVTSCNFLFGGIHPHTGEYYAHYHLEASGWGGRTEADGTSAQNHIHGNCRNTPVEVFETRFPFLTELYELVPDSGGPGRHRGGLGVRRVLVVTASRVTVSATMDRVKEGAWGLFGGQAGRCAAIAVRRRGEAAFRPFTEAFGTASPSKFAGIVLEDGDAILIESAGGGGYGPPQERERDLVRRDLVEGLVSAEAARDLYGVDVRG